MVEVDGRLYMTKFKRVIIMSIILQMKLLGKDRMILRIEWGGGCCGFEGRGSRLW